MEYLYCWEVDSCLISKMAVKPPKSPIIDLMVYLKVNNEDESDTLWSARYEHIHNQSDHVH